MSAIIQEWFSASDLKCLPKLPTTERGVRDKADRESWVNRRRAQKGGGREYHISSIPEEARAHLFIHYQKSQLETPHNPDDIKPLKTESQANENTHFKTRLNGLKSIAGLPSDHPKLKRARAREWVLRRWSDYAQAVGIKHVDAADAFITAYLSGVIIVPDAHKQWLPVLNGSRSLDRATLFRWRKSYQQRGLSGLTDGYGARKGRSVINENEALKNVVLGCMLKQPHITAKKIKWYLEAEHAELNTVSERSVQRFMSDWKKENAQLWTYMTHPDQWKNTYMVAFGSHHENVIRLNQLWEMDSTPADWMLQDGRHCVVGVIDMYSRRLKFRVSKTSKAESVCMTFRYAAIAWGVPEAVRTDNGKDYVSEQFVSVLRDLEIEHLLCFPFASEQKGTVERAMRTMSHGILDLLPGFIGHNVADRKKIEARKAFAQRIMQPGEVIDVQLSAAELQTKLNQWCEYVYARDAHEGLNGKTPFEVANNWKAKIKTISDERALDALLAEIAGTRTVTKKGLRVDHHHYVAPELAQLVGHEVRLKRDANDIGKLYVYDQAGVFVCIAQAYQLLGISSEEAAAVAKSHQKRLLSSQRDELKDAKRAVKENIADVVLQHRISQSQNVTAFPKRGDEYQTHALSEAGKASRNDRMPETQNIIDATELAEFQKNFRQEKAQIIESDDTHRRYERMMRIEQRIERGDSVGVDDQERLSIYKKSNEYRSTKSFYDDFGLTVSIDAGA